MIKTKEQYLQEIMRKRGIGTSFFGALICTGLVIAGFFTFGLTWVLAIIVGNVSTSRRRKKYYKTHQIELDTLYDAYYNRENTKRQKRAAARAQGIPTCPHCASDKVEVFASISNSFLGSYEYSHPKMVCKMCGRTFRPGE